MNQKSNESIQRIQKNIWIIIILIITALISGAGIYAWRSLLNRSKKQNLQDEITRLKQKIIQLEQQEVVDNTKLSNLTRYCSNDFRNYNQPVDETIINTLKAKDGNFKKYIDQGYRLREACKYTNRVLLFFDFHPGYFNKLGKINDSELSELAKNVILGVADRLYTSIDFYPTKVDDYRFEGPGDVACNFNQYEDDKIFYICVDADDAGRSKTWYVYDINQRKNIKVKYIYKGRYSANYNKEEVLDNKLLKLFTVKE